MGKTSIKYIAVVLAILLIPYIALCFYAHPSADDYSYAYEAMMRGYWQSQLYEFLHWNGRYTCNLMVLATPLVWHSFIGYRFVAFLLIFFTLLSAFFFISSVGYTVLSFLQKLCAALIFVALFLGMMPSLPQGIYWLTGAECYQVGNITAMLYVGLVFRYAQRHFIINKSVHFILCLFTLLVAVGCNEVLMLILLAAHSLVWLSLKKENKFRPEWFWLMLLDVALSSVMFFAPGNSVRSSFFTNNHLLLHSLAMAALQMVRFFALWVSFAPLVLASFLFINVGDRLYKVSPIFQQLAAIKLWQAFCLVWLTIFLCVFPAYWSTGILGQHRTLNTACFMFIPAWLMFVYIFFKRLQIQMHPVFLQKKVQWFVFLFMAAGLLFSGNCGKALTEFGNGKIVAFNNEMNTRYALLKTAQEKGMKAVYLPTLTSRPKSLFTFDIQPGYTHWLNKDYALYFGINRVYMDTAKSACNP